MTKVIRYTLEDYQRILHNGFDFEIPGYTNDTIRALADEVGAPTYVKTPEFFIKRQEEYDNINSTTFLRNRRNKKYKIQEISDDDWENIRTFEATEIKEKSEYEKLLDKIRTILNRVTNDNISDELLEIENILNSEERNKEFIKQSGKLVIEFATVNSFYSSIYSIIFNNFINKYESWKQLLKESKDEYENSFKNIAFFSSEEDYDKFCESNNINYKRRALSKFYSNLFDIECMSSLEIINIVLNIQDLINNYIKESNKKEHVTEITENLVIILNIVWEKLNNSKDKQQLDLVNRIVANLNMIVKLKTSTKTNISLTHKVIFKHLDLMKNLTLI